MDINWQSLNKLKLYSLLFIILVFFLSLFSFYLLSRASPRSQKYPVISETDLIEYNAFQCDDLVKSQGAKAALGLCLSEAGKGNVHAKARLGVLYSSGLLGAEDWGTAMKWFQQSADQGHPEAQYIVALNYAQGKGVVKNEPEAFRYASLSAQSEFLAAKTLVGHYYLRGVGVVRDIPQAYQWFLKSAQDNDPEAYYQLALLYLDGTSIAKDIPLAEKLLLKAAEHQHPLALIKLGDFHRLGLGESKNLREAAYFYHRAIETHDPSVQHYIATLVLNKNWQGGYDPIYLMTLSAEQGFIPAQLILAKFYHHGIHVKANDQLALKWYLASAQENDFEAQYQAGMIYLRGDFGHTKDIARAIAYFKKSAQGQYYPAQYALASLSAEGHEVGLAPKKVVEYLRQGAQNGEIDAQIKLAKSLAAFSLPYYDKVAFYWIEKAAKTQAPDACYLLAHFYSKGIGTEVLPEKSYLIYSDLAEKGHALSQLRLSEMYYYGQVVQKNLEQALYWGERAAKSEPEEGEAKQWLATLNEAPQ